MPAFAKSDKLLAFASLVPILVVSELSSEALLFKEVAISPNVSNVEGAELTKFAIAVSVYAVVATFVELSLAD